VFRINLLMNAWKRILEIGFIWARDIVPYSRLAHACSNLLACRECRLCEDLLLCRTKKEAQRCAAAEQRLCRPVALRFSERHLNALIAVFFGGLRQPLR
jgi:hypothetical protein